MAHACGIECALCGTHARSAILRKIVFIRFKTSLVCLESE